MLLHDDCIYEIAMSMDSCNVDTSRIVIEILACICNYDIEAHQMVLRAIDQVQRARCSNTRFDVLAQLVKHGAMELTRKRDKEHLHLLVTLGC